MLFATAIGPVVPPAGAVAFSCVEETWVTLVAGVPLNFTVELLSNPTPVIVTTVPAGPNEGLSPVIDRFGVKLAELEPLPAGVLTVIWPGVAPSGTTA